jgi:hypothetical protein
MYPFRHCSGHKRLYKPNPEHFVSRHDSVPNHRSFAPLKKGHAHAPLTVTAMAAAA